MRLELIEDRSDTRVYALYVGTDLAATIVFQWEDGHELGTVEYELYAGYEIDMDSVVRSILI